MTDKDWQIIEPKLKIINYDKADTILQAEEVCNKIRFINSGITRMFYFDENAKEFTCHLSFNKNNKNIIDYFAVDYNGFTTQTPSKYTIEALEKTQMVEISFDDIAEFSSQTTVFEEIFKIVNTHINLTMRDNFIDINMLSNTDRYKLFIETYKDIYKRIPQYIIASYLGITPVALSRLKAKLENNL
ncbi:Crp/Fnr family transcriptional regulator [Sulfurospirillum arcachonense]|uniref:Crp/Fnr family transcriptional regulator n=1 Tax=Sulfurospirillum arcachonense TaxID=57666 RepID=UPI0004694CD9|nr:Crp/Fnr family transcriptional regulator [Sulfurospirillum arcachonense]